MNFSKNNTFEQLREIDLVDFLASLGRSPAKVRGNNYWYISPLRDENTASFKVDRKINKWYDHGEGIGGNLVDFALRYFRCQPAELLDILSMQTNLPIIENSRSKKLLAGEERKVQILSHRSLFSYPLLDYLRERRIDFTVADKYCREVSYRITNFEKARQSFYAIGFRNDSGGFEIRNKHIKLASSPKDVTTIRNGSDRIVALEGFFNFLSFQTLYPTAPSKQPDFLILNSTSFFEKGLAIMDNYKTKHLLLDNDKRGRQCTDLALARGEGYHDQSHLYKGYADLNVMHCNTEQDQRQKKRNRIKR